MDKKNKCIVTNLSNKFISLGFPGIHVLAPGKDVNLFVKIDPSEVEQSSHLRSLIADGDVKLELFHENTKYQTITSTNIEDFTLGFTDASLGSYISGIDFNGQNLNLEGGDLTFNSGTGLGGGSMFLDGGSLNTDGGPIRLSGGTLILNNGLGTGGADIEIDGGNIKNIGTLNLKDLSGTLPVVPTPGDLIYSNESFYAYVSSDWIKIQNPSNTYVMNRPPTIDDSSSQGYSLGDTWFHNKGGSVDGPYVAVAETIVRTSVAIVTNYSSNVLTVDDSSQIDVGEVIEITENTGSDFDLYNGEQLLVSSKSGNDLTVTRGYNSTPVGSDPVVGGRVRKSSESAVGTAMTWTLVPAIASNGETLILTKTIT